MNNIETPIVVVAFNRPKSLKRLLESLGKANYSSNQIPLIISIDKADDNNETLKIAQDFKWKFGDKIINYEKTNLGLRNHVLKCGNLSEQYGSVIILEDDLYVSPNFYLFANQALSFSENQSYIGGISLYNHQINVHTMDNFAPLEDGYDNWYFQFASSWGQAWSKKQWNDFYGWYENNLILKTSVVIPKNVTNWSNKSWLKYYISYLIEKNKYFLYPKLSLSTNFSDVGTHVGSDSTAFQVHLDYSNKKHDNFSSLDESNSIYDAFYESTKLAATLGIKTSNLCVDLYGYKVNNVRYWLTTKIADFKILKTFGRSLKPIDANILQNIEGKDIFLYDTSSKSKNQNKVNRYRKLIYNIKFISSKDGIIAYLHIKTMWVKYSLRKLISF